MEYRIRIIEEDGREENGPIIEIDSAIIYSKDKKAIRGELSNSNNILKKILSNKKDLIELDQMNIFVFNKKKCILRLRPLVKSKNKNLKCSFELNSNYLEIKVENESFRFEKNSRLALNIEENLIEHQIEDILNFYLEIYFYYYDQNDINMNIDVNLYINDLIKVKVEENVVLKYCKGFFNEI